MLGEIDYLIEVRQPIMEELRLDILEEFDDWPGQLFLFQGFYIYLMVQLVLIATVDISRTSLYFKHLSENEFVFDVRLN